MIEYTQYLLRTNPLEFYTAVVATLGVVFWAFDRRSMNEALNATKGAEINALRLERQKTEASVERSFVALQIECQSARNSWREQEWRNWKMRGSLFHVSEEEEEIQRVEFAARTHLSQLKASAPELDGFEVDALEAYFNAANRTSLEFARLATQIPKPKNHIQ